MRVRTVVFMRHGQTSYNKQGRFQGSSDIPLNEEGHREAQIAGEYLATIGPAAIISSDLSRAQQTAQPLAEAAGVGITLDPRLQERGFGIWEGLSEAEVRQRWPEEHALWRTGGHPEGIGIETRASLADRFASAVDFWSKEHPEAESIVLVTHGAAIATGLAYILGQDPSVWRGIGGVANCHWSVLTAYKGHPAWRLTGHNLGAPSAAQPLGRPVI